jgi:glycerate 2-kinase
VTGTDPRRQLLLQLLQAALAAVDGRRCTADSLRSLLAESAGPIASASGTPGVAPRYHVAAVGKAACAMALGALDALGSRIERTLVIAKDGHLEAGVERLPGVRVILSSHPVPDRRSLVAGQSLCEFVDAMPADVVPVFLVSGGASSLAEVLAPGFTLQDLQQLNAAGLS